MLVSAYILLLALRVCLGIDLTYTVEEGKNAGTLLGDIAADTHLMDNIQPADRKLITFSQLQQGTNKDSRLFRISKETGKLYTAQELDAESLCRHGAECFRIVKIAVRQAETFMKILKMKVTIKDVNDHQPEFPVEVVNIQFSEDDGKGVRRFIPSAIDKDSGDLNSQIMYRLVKGKDEPFSLSVSESVDGISDLSIVLQERLNREVQDAYTVQVVAEDGGSPPKQSTLDVHVTVTDVNDNPPIFSQNVYNVSVNYESDEVMPVTIVSAMDYDSQQNGKISYRFGDRTSESAKSQFEIDEKTGEIFLRKKFSSSLQKTKFKLYVRATDNGNPALSSTAKVLVNIINEHNNAPTIDVNFVSSLSQNVTTIREDVEVGSFIAYVMVTDDDVGRNGAVVCDLQHEKFQLQSLGVKEYKLIVKNTIDREIEQYHDVTIDCQDKGSPPLHGRIEFTIRVIDVNDVRPKFFKELFKFSVYENQKSNSFVGTVNVTDPDLGPGGKLFFTLLSNETFILPFQISNTGEISTVMSLDYEFQNLYRFQVLVTDNGTPPLNNTANVIVEVRDENDNVPHFTFPSVNPFTMDVTYYPRHTNKITILKAADGDSRENAFLRYQIEAGDDKQLFAINHYTGLLSFSREVTQQDARTHLLQLVVKDSGDPVLTATTNLSIILTVSNQSSETADTIPGNKDNKIHVYLLIVIVLVAVTVAVPVTAAMSICVIRCKIRINSPLSDKSDASEKCVSEHKHLMCHAHMETYWPHTPLARTASSNIAQKSLMLEPRRRTSSGDSILRGHRRRSSSTGSRFQCTKEAIYEEIGEAPSNENNGRQFMIPDFYPESQDDWKIGDTSFSKEMSRRNMRRQPHKQGQNLPHSNQHHQNIKRARQMPEMFSSPCKTDTISGCIYKQPNIGSAHQHWSKCKNLNMAPSTPDRCLSGIGQHPLQDLSSMSSHNTPPFSSYQRKMIHSEKALHSPVIKYLIQVPDSRKLPLIPHIPKYNNQKM